MVEADVYFAHVHSKILSSSQHDHNDPQGYCVDLCVLGHAVALFRIKTEGWTWTSPRSLRRRPDPLVMYLRIRHLSQDRRVLTEEEQTQMQKFIRDVLKEKVT